MAFDWERSYTRAEWLDQLPTFGGHSQLPGQAGSAAGRDAGLATSIDVESTARSANQYGNHLALGTNAMSHTVR